MSGKNECTFFFVTWFSPIDNEQFESNKFIVVDIRFTSLFFLWKIFFKLLFVRVSLNKGNCHSSFFLWIAVPFVLIFVNEMVIRVNSIEQCHQLVCNIKMFDVCMSSWAMAVQLKWTKNLLKNKKFNSKCIGQILIRLDANIACNRRKSIFFPRVKTSPEKKWHL